MKLFAAIIKYLVAPMGTVIGLLYGFDLYVVSRSETTVLPLKTKVETIETYTKASLDRLELESRMMRSDVGEIKTILIKSKK